MTTPMERSRALRFAHEVLTLVSTRQEAPQDLRHQALVTLRHLPRPHEIASLATGCYEAVLPRARRFLAASGPLCIRIRSMRMA